MSVALGGPHARRMPHIFICGFTGCIILFHIASQTAGHAVAQWLRHCATNWTVAGSIPDVVIGIFH
jgi:hypothetical protein